MFRDSDMRNGGKGGATMGSGLDSSFQGMSSGAATNARDQMRSSVFNVDPSCMEGRVGGRDEVQTKPHNASARYLGENRGVPQPPAAMMGLPPRPPNPPLTEIGRSPTKSRVEVRAPVSAPDPQHVEMVLESLRGALRQRGAEGLQGLARNFRICDTNPKNGKLDADEVRKCLRLCRIELEHDDFAALLSHLDGDGNGVVDYDEFLKAVRGRMPICRRKLVVSVFNAIDQNGQQDGHLSVEDIAHVFDAKGHPEVKAGKRSETSVLTEMLTNFEGKKGNRDGTVTLEEWVDYYEDLSSSVEHDDHFAQIIIGAWSNLFPPKRPLEQGGLPLPVPKAKVDALEKLLVEAIRTRSSGASETAAVEKVFKQFDTDGSGTIAFGEFTRAMERFGLLTGGHGDVSGCTPDSILALFERYDPDGSGALSYDEFIKGLYKMEAAPALRSARGAPPPTDFGTSLPLPSERGEGRRPPTANPITAGADAHYGRGRGGMLNGGVNMGISATQPSAGAQAMGARSATVNGFNKSSGIFR